MLLSAVALFEASGPLLGPFTDLLSFKIIGLNYAMLKQLVDEHFVLAGLLYVLGYGLLGLLLLPGSAILVVMSGLLFGAVAGVPLASIGSALAASLAFGTATFALGGPVSRLTHPAVDTLRTGFQRHALSYLMFLRLTPGLPFALINAAAALLGVRFSTFLLGSLVGLLPSRIALSTAGAGLGKAIAIENGKYNQCVAERPGAAPLCTYDLDVSSLLTVETIAAFFALALLALSPAILDFASRLRRP